MKKELLEMRKTSVRILALAFLCAMTCAGKSFASAILFDWSYTGATVSASGTLIATDLGAGAFQVTSISGMRDGVAITGLTSYAGEDQLVYSLVPQLDYFGLAFTDANGFAYNVYYDTSTIDVYACGSVGYCEIGPGTPGTSGLGPPADPMNPISFTLTRVPEPATLALLGLGLAGLGFSRRKQ